MDRWRKLSIVNTPSMLWSVEERKQSSAESNNKIPKSSYPQELIFLVSLSISSSPFLGSPCTRQKKSSKLQFTSLTFFLCDFPIFVQALVVFMLRWCPLWRARVAFATTTIVNVMIAGSHLATFWNLVAPFCGALWQKKGTRYILWCWYDNERTLNHIFDWSLFFDCITFLSAHEE